jgi:hypothetical protein
MRRREFIKVLGGAAAGWPLAAHAQQSTGRRRIGALMNIAENDPQSLVWASAFERGLRERGWALGNNLQVEYRWANDENLYRRFANELVALSPEAVLAVSGSYGPDTIDQFRRAAGYVDRILKGEKPADMPVQTPSKFELVLNLRAAQGIDLNIPARLLNVADHVIR